MKKVNPFFEKMKGLKGIGGPPKESVPEKTKKNSFTKALAKRA